MPARHATRLAGPGLSLLALASTFGAAGCLAPGATGSRFVGAGGPVTGQLTSPDSTPSPVLTARWRRLLTDPGLIEYKPQEFASPAADGKRVFAGAHGGIFYALRRRDGEVLWKRHIPGGLSGRPLYHPGRPGSDGGGAVYVGGDDGALYCLDAQTGKDLWTYHTKGPIRAQPVWDDGSVFFTNGENRIYALDGITGAWRWQYDREAPETFTIRGEPGPLLFGGRAYAGFSDGYLAALNSRTGDVIWARSIAAEGNRFNDVDSTPILEDGTLYVSSYSGGVYALDPGEGGVRWRFEVEGAGSLRVHEGRVYFAATHGGLHCLDTKGRVLWRQALAKQGELSGPVTVDDRYVLVSAAEGGTYVADARTGRLLQFFGPGHGVTAAPTVDGDQIYALTNTGFLYAFALR